MSPGLGALDDKCVRQIVVFVPPLFADQTGSPRRRDKNDGEVDPHDREGDDEGLEVTGHRVVFQFPQRAVVGRRAAGSWLIRVGVGIARGR